MSGVPGDLLEEWNTYKWCLEEEPACVPEVRQPQGLAHLCIAYFDLH